LEKFKSSNPNVQVFSTAKGIDLIQGLEEHGDHNHMEGVDPHIWSSPKEARTIAKNIFDGMVQIDPENKVLFQQNLKSLLTEIDRVDSTINLILKKVTAKKFIIFHPALGYFARDYGLEQLSIEFEGKVPSPKHLQTVIEEAKLGNIGFILIQKEFDKENAEIISKETGSKIIQIDPLAYDWPAQMIDIAEKLSLPNQSTN
jgi:zinc transport system substrate-binding protein